MVVREKNCYYAIALTDFFVFLSCAEHYLLALGNIASLNSGFNHLGLLPLERLGDHLVIGKTCDNDGVWGIHVDDLSPKKQHNPMVQMSRNFDAIEQGEIH